MGPKKNNKKFYIVVGAIAYAFILLLSCHMGVYAKSHPSASAISTLFGGLSHMFSNVFDFIPIPSQAFGYIGILTLIAVFVVLALYVNQERNHVDMAGKESGSAKWFDKMDKYNEKYSDPKGSKDHNGTNNMILSNEVFLNMDTRKTFFNNNILVIGGSGSGKSRFFVKPNILQANANYVVTDPAGEMLASMGKFLENQGYEIRVFNLVEMTKSHCYNPFVYVRNDEDVLTMIDCLITNTTPPNSKGGDQFWVKSEQALLQALCFYLIENCPPEERNFGSVIELLRLAEVDENNPDKESTLDRMFSTYKAKNPGSMAIKSYDIFKMGAGKTLKSILISCGVRLQVFNLKAVANLTNIDTIDLASIGTGEQKKALFVITPQASETYNFLVSMLYSQLFETLYYEGNKLIETGGSFKHEIRFLLDEFVNIGQIPQFTKKLATMRKYRISCSIIIQNLAQIKALYEKDWETIIGNCDSMIFLGGLEYSTLEYISNILGTRTIRTRSEGRSRGKSGSSSLNFQKTQRKLMNPDEVGNMPNTHCIIKIRSLDPFFTPKYDYPKHHNYHLTGDANDSYKYVNKLDNSLATLNLDNALSEADLDRYKKIKEIALNGKPLFTKPVPLETFINKKCEGSAIEFFNKYKAIKIITDATPEEQEQAEQLLINELLSSINDERAYDIVREISNQKELNNSSGTNQSSLGSQIIDKIAEEYPDDTDDFINNFFGNNS